MEAIDFRPVLLAWAEVQARELKPKKCAKMGVGALIVQMRADAVVANVFGDSSRRALLLLEDKCRSCGKCVFRDGAMRPIRR